jgi:hypothetical protein
MWKNLFIFVLIAIGVVYVVSDKPIVHTIEHKDEDGKTKGVTVNVTLGSNNTNRIRLNILIGGGNTVNYNYKDEE